MAPEYGGYLDIAAEAERPFSCQCKSQVQLGLAADARRILRELMIGGVKFTKAAFRRQRDRHCLQRIAIHPTSAMPD